MFCGPTQEPVLATVNIGKTWERSWERNAGEWTGRVAISKEGKKERQEENRSNDGHKMNKSIHRNGYQIVQRTASLRLRLLSMCATSRMKYYPLNCRHCTERRNLCCISFCHLSRPLQYSKQLISLFIHKSIIGQSVKVNPLTRLFMGFTSY